MLSLIPVPIRPCPHGARSRRFSCVNPDFCVLSSEFSPLGPKQDSKRPRKGLDSGATPARSTAALGRLWGAFGVIRAALWGRFFSPSLAHPASNLPPPLNLPPDPQKPSSKQFFFPIRRTLQVSSLQVFTFPIAQHPRNLLTTDNGPRTTDHRQNKATDSHKERPWRFPI